MGPEPPLSDREIRILRGMMDEYEYGRMRRVAYSRSFAVLGRVVAALAAGAVLVSGILQIIGR